MKKNNNACCIFVGLFFSYFHYVLVGCVACVMQVAFSYRFLLLFSLTYIFFFLIYFSFIVSLEYLCSVFIFMIFWINNVLLLFVLLIKSVMLLVCTA